jgi:aminoglycoside 6-adenylyltransferase
LFGAKIRGRVPPRKTNAQSHFIPLPDQDSFQEHVREFYWCAGNVVKGLARQNLVYANEQFNRYVRPELLTLLEMRATMQQNGRFDAGVTGKFIEPTLSAVEKTQLSATYQQTSLPETKASLRKVLQLYRGVSEQISGNYNFDLPKTITKVYQQFNMWLSA